MYHGTSFGSQRGVPVGSSGTYRQAFRSATPGSTTEAARSSSTSTRPAWRGRDQRNSRHGSGHWRSGTVSKSLPVADEAPVGSLVTEIKLEDIKDLKTSAAELKISNVEFVASYSLTDSKTPKIIVPGKPALWTPPAPPVQLKWDQGEFLRDENGARFSKYPILPAVQSVFALNESYDPSCVDIIGCASSLGNLLRFARSIEATFRFDVEVIGNTLFIIRNAKDEKISDVRGYGHSFLDTFTSHAGGLNKTKSHQRIVGYQFEGLNCLVRFECDGYDAALDNSKDHKSLIEVMQSAMPLSSLRDAISMEVAGNVVAQRSIIEIKTRARNRGDIELSEHIPRMWVRQIPNFVAGYHEHGIFEDVQKNDVQDEMVQWEKDHQSELQNFASAMHWLVTEVKRAGHASLEVYRQGNGPLQLREHVGEVRRALPEEWSHKWLRLDLHQSSEEESSDSDDEQGYPALTDLRATKELDDDDDDDTAAFDYTACNIDCGYCGNCDY